MRRSRRPSTALLGLLIPLMLVGGIWLGGHPDNLPGFVRGPLVGDSEGRTYQEALDVIEGNYYRRVNPHALVNTGLRAAVDSLHDRFSHYFDPRAYQAFRES